LSNKNQKTTSIKRWLSGRGQRVDPFAMLPSPSFIFVMENWDYIAMLKDKVEEIKNYTAVD